MPRVGRQTWSFTSGPRLVATGTVSGLMEANGPLGADFDEHIDETEQGESWEKTEQSVFAKAAQLALDKARQQADAVDLMIGGDLNAQLTGFYFGLRNYAIPAFGVYSACATVTQGLALGALAIDTGVADRVLVGASSHTATAERQFRYPLEYGAQKPPSAQRTVTGAGVALLSRSGGNIEVTHATIGSIVDYGITNPWEYGAAMAPAAAATIAAHLSDTGRTLADYDCVATGDLGRIGHAILVDLLSQRGIAVRTELTDCGMLIYRPDQPEVFAGGSGAGCCALVTFGHFWRRLESGEWRRILVSATGALLSPVTAQQCDTIPAVSHAIVLERKDG